MESGNEDPSYIAARQEREARETRETASKRNSPALQKSGDIQNERRRVEAQSE